MKKNDKGVKFGNDFCLNYFGVILFFTVVWTKKDIVYLIELATKKYNNGIRFTKKIRATKHPLVILEKNVYRKSEYFVFPANIAK